MMSATAKINADGEEEPPEKAPSDKDYESDNRLTIIEEAPTPKKKRKASPASSDAKVTMPDFGQDIDKMLDEKAAKTNLKGTQVKNILKHVVTNEDVLALVLQAEKETDEKFSLTYEPKYTRAKAKEMSCIKQPIHEWATPIKKASKTQLLINEELAEDSSGDEYIPGEEESEDDRESSTVSENDSSGASTTPQSANTSTQTVWTEDGVFKVPTTKNKGKAQEPNIALRTRSKLCLSNTPLEVIEEAFIPPDITTDMYDMECDDDDWKNFLKEFTRPLNEVPEDEDLDPEYNILADEEIDKIDKEELRADKAVNITRKELNALMAELFDYADNFDKDLVPPAKPKEVTEQESAEAQENAIGKIYLELIQENQNVFQDDQKLLLGQQMRQHVQLITQNFLLTYEHPEYHDMSKRFKSYLLYLESMCDNHENSHFNVENLQPALSLLADWKQKFESNDLEVLEHKAHVNKVLCEWKQARAAGLYTYIPSFPKYFLDVVSKSSVFLYPALLPRIPFKSSVLIPKQVQYTHSEIELLALALEQFMPYLRMDPRHVKCNKVKMGDVCYYINKYVLPCKDAVRMVQYIRNCIKSVDSNPVKHYYQYGKTQPCIHYVIPLDQYKMLPPCQRLYDDLPELWKKHIYPDQKQRMLLKVKKEATLMPIAYKPVPIACKPVSIACKPSTKVTKPPPYNKTFRRKRKLTPKPEHRNAKVLQNISLNGDNQTVISSSESKIDKSDVTIGSDVFCSTPKQSSKHLENRYKSTPKNLNIPNNFLKIKFNSSIFEKVNQRRDKMLPSMPNLFSPVRCSPDTTVDLDERPNISRVTIKIEATEESEEKLSSKEQPKDNLDDINALMVASSTIKNLAKRKPTCAEKKKAKLLREFSSNLRMLSPEDDDAASDKTNRFVQAFYDKVEEQLEPTDYNKFVEVLNNFEESRNTTTELYNSIAVILGQKHPDLLDEFLSCYTSMQAKTIGKLVPHMILQKMSLFLRKLELFFKDQPSQVRKIYRTLTDLTTSHDVTMAHVKNTMLPLLKGNGLLMDWFLQIFPNEKPTNSLLNGPWERVDIGKETTLAPEELYETITVPEIEDPYGGTNCICSCHSVDNGAFKSRSMHCIPCGTKGRVFVQTGKGLRLAKITFDDDSVDHMSRLACRTKAKRSETIQSKQISPSKESQDETKLSSDEEPDKKRRLVKATKKRKPRKKISTTRVANKLSTVKPVVDAGPPSEKTGTVVKKDGSDQNTENTSDSSINEIKQVAEENIEENIEWDCNTSIESIELKLSPEHPSAESESEFCEETSQDNNTDSEPSGGESESNSPDINCQWTRDEDKTILQTFQKVEDKETAFKQIAQRLEHRTLAQIKQRFEILINLLKKMSKNS